MILLGCLAVCPVLTKLPDIPGAFDFSINESVKTVQADFNRQREKFFSRATGARKPEAQERPETAGKVTAPGREWQVLLNIHL
jgi:hypothetical protein